MVKAVHVGVGPFRLFCLMFTFLSIAFVSLLSFSTCSKNEFGCVFGLYEFFKLFFKCVLVGLFLVSLGFLLVCLIVSGCVGCLGSLSCFISC